MTTSKKTTPSSHTDDDYEYARQTYIGLIEKVKDAIEGASQVAEETEHPRAYEVLGALLKNAADMTDKLLENHRRKQVIDEKKPQQPPQIGAPIIDGEASEVFHGTVADLQKSLKVQ